MKYDLKIGDLVGYKSIFGGNRYCKISHINGEYIYGDWKMTKEEALNAELVSNESMPKDRITFHRPKIPTNWRELLKCN